MTKTKKIIDLVLKISWWVVFALLFVLVISIVSAKVKGEVPKILGYSVIKVATPSMQESLPVDTYILIKETDPKNVQPNDIICFYSEDSKIYGYPNTHRVVRVIEKDGKYEFVTKGDSNAIEDSVTAKGEKLIGKYVKTLKVVTFISNTVKSQDMAIVFVIMFVVSLGVVITSIVLKPKNKKTQD
jgi:signal peptidase